MDRRRSPWMAAIRLAAVVSAVAAAVTVALTAFGNVSQTAMVIAVIVVAFVVSWIHSGRGTTDAGQPPERPLTGTGGSGANHRTGGHGNARHRVSVVRVHHHTG